MRFRTAAWGVAVLAARAAAAEPVLVERILVVVDGQIGRAHV